MSGSIFISHSAKDAAAGACLEKVAQYLREQGFDVWLDKTRLKGSDDWRVVIANSMAECSGAVALFSETALTSPYFQFEVSNLLARWTREQADPNLQTARKFCFCPVIVPPLTIKTLKKDPFVAATYFGAVNWITLKRDSDYRALGAAFGQLDPSPSPLEALEGSVRAILERVGDHRVYLDAARDAGFDSSEMGAPGHYATRLAQLLMRCPVVTLYASLRRLQPVLGDDIQTLVDLLAPSWVSFEAGLRFDSYLCLGHRRPPEDRFAVIRGSERSHFTSLMYLLRARRTNQAAAGDVVVIPSPEGGTMSFQSFLYDAHTELGRFLWNRFAKHGSPDSARELKALAAALKTEDLAKLAQLLPPFVQRLVRSGRAVILVTAASAVDFDIIQQVSSRPEFNQVTFVATSLQEPSSTHHNRQIVPDLARDYEEENYLAYEGFKAGAQDTYP